LPDVRPIKHYRENEGVLVQQHRGTLLAVLAMTLGMTLGMSAAKAQQQVSQTAEVIPGEYIVKLKSMAGPAGVLSKMQGKIALKGSFQGINMYHVALKNDAEAAANFDELVSDPDVEYVEPNFVFRKAVSTDPEGLSAPSNIYSVDQLQALDQYSASSTTYSQSGANTKVAQAWSIESVSALRPIVAIIDTGLDANHPAIINSQALWVNNREIPGNNQDDDYNGYTDDINGWNFVGNVPNFADDEGHGTHVAGIVLGTGMNILASPVTEQSKIRIMPLKFLDASGSGSTSNAIRAIYYAVNNGAQVINNSWGGSSYSRSLHEAMTFAYTNRVFIASASGNNGRSNDTTPMYPANYDVPSNVSVAATSDYDYIASFSNFGTGTVHIASPGVQILSLMPNNSTGTMSGTSMATPFVSGLAALAMRESPGMTGYQIKNIMLAKAARFAQLSSKVTTSGRIDALALITEAKAQANAQSSQPGYNPTYQAERSSASDSTPKTGCGLVSAALLKGGPGSGIGSGEAAGGEASGALVLIGLLMMPVILWAVLRQRALAKNSNPASRRLYDRFKMDSDIRVAVGDRELVASLKTISLGGASFSADEALEKGGIITMKITSPDGKDIVEVQGQVVWNEANHAYGVQFAGAPLSTLSVIQKWTHGLMKA
jgi:subtilisin family serine protease